MKRILLYCLCLIILSVKVNAQNKLDKSKKELTEKEAVKNTNSKASSSSSSDGFEDDFGLLEGAFNYTIGAVWLGLVGSYENEDHLYNALLPYPNTAIILTKSLSIPALQVSGLTLKTNLFIAITPCLAIILMLK